MMIRPSYFDYAATTPMDKRVVEKMQHYMTHEGIFGNPASQHRYGQAAREAIEEARYHVAQGIHAEASEIIWTSGATESNNLALKGVAHLYQRKGKHIITVQTEHKSVLDCCQQLEKEGFTVSYLKPESNGLVALDKLEAAIRDDTILLSIMHVNNEIGVIQDIATISKMTAARGILLHVDAAQSIGKIALDVHHSYINLMSLSAHKVYGPKGIGALYLRKKPRVRVSPLMHGGGQEQGMRAGTLATHQIVGMGEAFLLGKQEQVEDTQRIAILRQNFLEGLQRFAPLHVNGDLNATVPHILNIRFEGMIADALLAQWPHLVASTASACQSKSGEGSYVLRALGLTEEQAKSSIRFSFGRFTSKSEIDSALNEIMSHRCKN